MKKLYIFTSQYPYSNIESFLDEEILYLSQRFQTIYIVPSYGYGKKRDVPDNCYVFEPLNFNAKGKIFYYLIGIFCYRSIKIIINEFFVNKVYRSKTKLYYWLSYSLSLNNYLHNKTIVDISKIINSNDVCYFYWGVGANILSHFWKDKVHLISRFHGEWDLWEESYFGYVPYRRKVIKALDYAVFISKLGETYFNNKYPQCKTKFYPLGSMDNGISIKSNDNYLRIVSCSTVYSLKRVDFICDSVVKASEKFNVIWTHIGSGEDFKKLQRKIETIQAQRIEINLLGMLTHSEVIKYYQTNKIDIFINLSTSEGVPVSIMEAISYDIPVIATNVGGNSEIVTKETGVLLKSNPTIDDVAVAIEYIVQNMNSFTPRLFWNSHYNADNNYSSFAKMLYNLE